MSTDLRVVGDLTHDELEELDDRLLLCPGGRMRLLPAAELRLVGERLIVWAHKRARYTLVTSELVDWLAKRIEGKRTIEIAAGMGDLGYYLRIPQSDLGLRRAFAPTPFIASIDPPKDVERMEAEEAVMIYRPDVVLGSWVTERRPEIIGYGVREEEMFARGRTYIHVGNDNPHGEKRIMQCPHTTHRFDWIMTRAWEPNRNYIRVWGPELFNPETVGR